MRYWLLYERVIWPTSAVIYKQHTHTQLKPIQVGIEGRTWQQHVVGFKEGFLFVWRLFLLQWLLFWKIIIEHLYRIMTTTQSPAQPSIDRSIERLWPFEQAIFHIDMQEQKANCRLRRRICSTIFFGQARLGFPRIIQMDLHINSFWCLRHMITYKKKDGQTDGQLELQSKQQQQLQLLLDVRSYNKYDHHIFYC